MESIVNIIFVAVFFCMAVITGKVLFDSNFEKLFKQGKVAAIKVGYAIVIVIVSFLFAYGIKELVWSFYNILK